METSGSSPAPGVTLTSIHHFCNRADLPERHSTAAAAAFTVYNSQKPFASYWGLLEVILPSLRTGLLQQAPKSDVWAKVTGFVTHLALAFVTATLLCACLWACS